MNEWLRDALAVALGALSAWIAFRIRFERFDAMDKEREKAWWVWRDGLDEQLAERERQSERNTELLQRLEERVKALERDQNGIREWKHVVIDPYVPGAVNALKDRVDRIDRRVFNGRRDEER